MKEKISNHQPKTSNKVLPFEKQFFSSSRTAALTVCLLLTYCLVEEELVWFHCSLNNNRVLQDATYT